MPYCPNCGEEVAIEADRCPTCDAQFLPPSEWRPVAERPLDVDIDELMRRRAAAADRSRQRESSAETEVSTPGTPTSIWSVLLFVYLTIVVVAHVVTISIAQGTSGIVFVAWIFLGGPLFIPGAALGIMCFVHAASASRDFYDRVFRFNLGLALTGFPLWELYLIKTAPQGVLLRMTLAPVLEMPL